jgi:hypothetical protein
VREEGLLRMASIRSARAEAPIFGFSRVPKKEKTIVETD